MSEENLTGLPYVLAYDGGYLAVKKELPGGAAFARRSPAGFVPRSLMRSYKLWICM